MPKRRSKAEERRLALRRQQELARVSRRPPCVHCGVKKAWRPKGLCFGCWERHRHLYPSTSKHARKGSGLKAGPAPLPAVPTDAEPGSTEKMRVMQERAARGEAIFHPLDKRRSLK